MSSPPLQIVAALLGLLLFAKWLWGRRGLYALSLKVQGPLALPFVGNAPMLLRILRDGNPFQAMLNVAKTYPGMYRVWFGPFLHLIVIDPEDVESVFHKSVVAKPPLTLGSWSQAMGNGLLTMTAIGKESPWKEHKKILNPSLGVNVNREYYEHLLRNCGYLVEDVGKLCRGDEMIEFGRVLLRFCGDAVSESMYGVEMNFRSGNRDNLFEAVETMTDGVYKKAVRIWYHIGPLYERSELGRKQKAATQIIREFSQEVFDMRHRQLNNNRNVKCPDQAVVESLLKAHCEGQMSESEVVEEIMNMWNAASDTTGSVIQFAVLMLAMHKHCQDKIYREVMDYYSGDVEAPIDFQDLAKFTYLDMFIKETLRFFAPGAISVRYATEEFEFKSRKFKVPAGTNLVLLGYLTHKDPKIWDNPCEFRPERFLPEEVAKRHPYSFFAFSGGPRKCSGRSYAKMLLTTSIAHLVRVYEFENPWKLDELPLRFDIDVRSVWGYKAKISRRKPN